MCHYSPPGNYPGKVYERGNPCSNCGKKKCQDGLCTEEGDEVTDKPIGEYFVQYFNLFFVLSTFVTSKGEKCPLKKKLVMYQILQILYLDILHFHYLAVS